jgi:hypothetical protein
MERSDIEAATSEVAAAVVAQLAEVSHDVWQRLIQEIPDLQGDELIVNLLAASVEENIATVLHMLEYGIVPQSVDAPAAAVEYARRLAQRGMSMIALVRAYRLGHARFLEWCLDELGRQTGMTEAALAVTHQLLEISFSFVDRTSEQVVLAYQLERDNWLVTQTAVRAGRVQAVLSGAELDVDATEAALGYRLRQTHLGVVAWVTDPVPGGRGVVQLNRLVNTIATELGCPSRPLFIPSDESLAWAWLPLGPEGNPTLSEDSVGAQPSVASLWAMNSCANCRDHDVDRVGRGAGHHPLYSICEHDELPVGPCRIRSLLSHGGAMLACTSFAGWAGSSGRPSGR